jgi:hypothetical protein
MFLSAGMSSAKQQRQHGASERIRVRDSGTSLKLES